MKQYTNVPELWEKLGFEEKHIALWDADLGDIKYADLDWNNIRKIFIFGVAGITQTCKSFPCPVEYFDSAVISQPNYHINHGMLEFVKSHFVNHKIHEKLKSATEKSNSLQFFDALLGLKKPHRDFVANWIQDSRCQEKYFLSYYQMTNNWQSWIPGYWDEEKQPFSYSGDVIEIPGAGRWVPSHIVPVNIYNQTFYSIVTETFTVEPTILTEKIWKPILAKRLFVVFANRNYLRDLKSFGYKTFDCVIDESYDTIDNDTDRWSAAMAQCDWLCLQDPEKIIEKCSPVLEHNFNLAMKDYREELEQNLLKVSNR